ncbi:MAG TPA: diaminopimelate epimerase [Candidatus Copromorpha excrementigallinarum]|uniref:Diaminopimelate epimerase n=1 Tax=Candidatus Allocopromorpha excrementigallinarum TaxID=2840742 RepID=A0A9D1L780_9FIRM|nr:diaminopimelate epimerase [Candidatus Copromorpha excrementigallinarum]
MREELIDFSKYHGCGNSFVIARERDLPVKTVEEFGPLAREMCSMNTGIGADGFIVVREEPELEMVFFNMDGSRAPMCGNGIRCFAHFCREKGIREEDAYSVKTLAGEMKVEVTGRDPFKVRINMGRPVFTGEAIEADIPDDRLTDVRITLEDGREIKAVSMFMGTVHTVVPDDELDEADVEKTGREICSYPLFKEKTNVNFVKVIDDTTLRVRTYERGVGVTPACGTGACASVVAASLLGKCGKAAVVELPLGKLSIEISGDGDVYMEGPSERISEGKFYRKGKIK